MPDVVVRAEAAADMADIYRFSLEHFGESIAAEYMTGLDEALTRLGAFPELGRLDRGIEPPIHVFSYRSHRVYYDFDGAAVSVVRVLHHAMNAATHLTSR